MKRWSELRPSTKRRYAKLGVTPRRYNAWALNPALRKRARAKGIKRHTYLNIPAPKPRKPRPPLPAPRPFGLPSLTPEQVIALKRDNTRRKLLPVFMDRLNELYPEKDKNPRALEKFTFRHLPDALIDRMTAHFAGPVNPDPMIWVYTSPWDSYEQIVESMYRGALRDSYLRPWYN